MRVPDEKIQKMKDILEKRGGKEVTWAEASDASTRLSSLMELLLKHAQEDWKREQKLKEYPKGFSLGGVGYSCFICGQGTSLNGNWYDKYGIKCMVCQDSINRKEIPASLSKDKESWYSKYDLEGSFNLKAPTLRGWIKRGIIKARTLTYNGKGDFISADAGERHNQNQLGGAQWRTAILLVRVMLADGPAQGGALGRQDAQAGIIEPGADLVAAEGEVLVAEGDSGSRGGIQVAGAAQQRQMGFHLPVGGGFVDELEVTVGQGFASDAAVEASDLQGQALSAGRLLDTGLLGDPFELDLWTEIGVLFARDMPELRAISDGESGPVGLELGVAAAGDEAEVIVEDIEQVVAVLNPAVGRYRAGVGRHRPLPGLLTADQPLAVADPGRGFSGGRRGFEAGATLAIQQHPGSIVGANGAAFGHGLAYLLQQVAAPLGGEGEANGAVFEACMVDLPFVQTSYRRAVGPEHGGVELRRPAQGLEDDGVLRDAVVDADGVDVDLVVANHGAEVLRPETGGVLLGDGFGHEGGCRGAPLGLVEGHSGEVERHGLVAGNVMNPAVHDPADAREAEAQAFLPGGAVRSRQGVFDQHIGPDPAAVGPGHIDLAPGGVVLLAKGPHALLVLVVGEGLTATGDGGQHPVAVIPRILVVLDGPGGGQGQQDVLVDTDPGLRAEASGRRVLALEDRFDAVHEALEQVFGGWPDRR